MSVLSTYQELSQATSQWPPGSEGFGSEQHRRYVAMSFAGEAGEAADALKKHLAGMPLDRDKVRGELGDVSWSLAAACELVAGSFATLIDSATDKLGRIGRDPFEMALCMSKHASAFGTYAYVNTRLQGGLFELDATAFFFVALCKALDFSLDEVLEANLQKLAKRYPSGSYSHQDSIARRDVKEVTPC